MMTAKYFARSLHLPAGLILCLALAGGSPARAQQSPPKGPPPTRTDNAKETIHGVEVVDPYRWLEDQTSPETRAWIDAQNQHTASLLRKLPQREGIAKQLGELMKVDSVQIPAERGGRYFFMKRAADQDLNVLYIRKGLTGPDEVLVDPHPLSPDHTTSISLMSVSEDGRLVAYGLRAGGEDERTVHLLDVDARKELPDRLPRADYFGVSIKPDATGIYYSRMTPEGPRVYYHGMGTDPVGDAEIFGKGYGPGKIIGIDLSEDGHYLLITVLYGSGVTRSELYFENVREHGPILPVVNDLEALFFGGVAGDTLFLRTNWKAPFWRVFGVDLKKPARDFWREIIPEGDATVEEVHPAGGKLLVNYTRNAATQLKLFESTGKPAGEVSLPGIGSVNGITTRWSSPEAFFSFVSYSTPNTVYRYDVTKQRADVWAKPKVPVDSGDFEVKQVWYESKDKTRVPMFLFYRKGIKPDGSNRVLLTGYGGFDVSMTPRFSEEAVLWAKRGGVYAVANMRGGGEFGEAWHHAGMLEKKQNVFDDFIAAAEWLVAQRYTTPGKLSIMGTSNGGLLMGAMLTQRPDLFQAVVCRYPLEDMVRYQKFFVAQFWVPEYGSSDDPKQFPYLYSYSPYHHVQPGTKYPAALFVTGDGDTRVAPLHARKMAARLQAATASDRPILLLYDTKSGHSGGRPLSKQIEEITDELSFLFWQLGMNDK